jgi:nucleoside-diphosphate-sugar epimerase
LNILIIGGTRFMGPEVVRRLVECGHTITVFHRGETESDLPDSVNQIHGDRNELDQYKSQFESLQPDLVLDMILLIEKQARLLVDVMTGITRRLVIISSADVYGNYGCLRGDSTETYTDGPLSETSPLRKNTYPYRTQAKDEKDLWYWYDKILVEKTVMAQNSLAWTILRLPIVYGPGDPQHRFRDYVQRMVDNRRGILLDEHKAGWRITRGYSGNCAGAITAAVTSETTSGKVYNVGEPTALAEREWITRIAKTIGWTGKIVTLPDEKLPPHLQSPLNWKCDIETDTSRFRRETGFEEETSFDHALQKTVEWEAGSAGGDDKLAEQYRAEDRALREAGA